MVLNLSVRITPIFSASFGIIYLRICFEEYFSQKISRTKTQEKKRVRLWIVAYHNRLEKPSDMSQYSFSLPDL